VPKCFKYKEKENTRVAKVVFVLIFSEELKSCAAFLEQLVENERILENPLDGFDEDGRKVEAGRFASQHFHACTSS
jgi:hypothetical protein